jgi:hypothetical protein
MQINHKRVVRIMREDNLLGLQPKRFKVTTDSNHKVEVYLNLAARMKLTGIQSALGGGHHLHSAEGGICLLGGDPRLLGRQDLANAGGRAIAWQPSNFPAAQEAAISYGPWGFTN